VLESRRLYEGRVVNLREDTVQMADGRRASEAIHRYLEAL